MFLEQPIPEKANRITGDPETSFRTAGGIGVHRSLTSLDYGIGLSTLARALDERRGMLLASGFDFPGRYTRWDMGFVDPPIVVTARGRHIEITALNERGRVLLPVIAGTVRRLAAVEAAESSADAFTAAIRDPGCFFLEEERTKQPTIFAVLRAIIDLFHAPDDDRLGLYGAFGYDLAFQVDPISLKLGRGPGHRDLVLYIPDELVVVDHCRRTGTRFAYEFEAGGQSTKGLPRTGARTPFRRARRGPRRCDHQAGEYADKVRRAREAFRQGALFEVVLSQTFTEPCTALPSDIFARLRRDNPAPYGFLMNLGEGEHLVGASPEMFVRVTGDRVETCPIAGTIARGRDAVEDAEQIRRLLNSEKDAAELTMCTDVDRNDKGRICEPGSVRLIGRRQIEMYSKLIHTVDHVEGRLRPGYDAVDAFQTHVWAVTVTGAPKRDAMQFIEQHEVSPRRWYAGAVGVLGFDGSANTGLTLRTLSIQNGVAEIRVGATLLYDSVPEAEQAECELKASALFDAIRPPEKQTGTTGSPRPSAGVGRRVLLVDHRDSFVHVLGDYFRQTGADVVTVRRNLLKNGCEAPDLGAIAPDLVVLSPGPGRPRDFAMTELIAEVRELGLPLFGVCLGLQGLAEYYGAELGLLGTPQHGKAVSVRLLGGRLFRGLPREITVGSYHSLQVLSGTLPHELQTTAIARDGRIMALEHRSLPWAAVQFHPESLLSLGRDVGRRIIANAMMLAESADQSVTKGGAISTI